MKIIRVKPNQNDLIDKAPHPSVSRRDFLKRGLATTVLSTVAPTTVLASLMARKANAMTCPTNMRMPGGLVQLYRNGGCAMGACFLNSTQATHMSATIASDYGITNNIVQYGSNWWLDPSTAFALGVITPPPGWTGGNTAWLAALKRTSLGGHYGVFNADDAPGNSQGQLGGCGSMKPSFTLTDVSLSANDPRAGWARSLPAYKTGNGLSGLTPANLQSGFGMVPSTGMNPTFLTNTAKTTDTLSQIFASVFSNGRANQLQSYTNAMCGFYGDSTIANPSFAGSLFDYTQISALTSAMTVASLSPEMQAFLVAAYQSAFGNIGGVIIDQGGNDYHPPQPQTAAAPLDYEAGQIFAMWLAASVAAGNPSAFILNSNGRVRCSGVTSNTFTVNGASITANGPTSVGDAGGSYNAGLIVLYGATSAPAGLLTTGTFNTTTGGVTASSSIGSVPDAMAGLYLTALKYCGFDVASAISFMASQGVMNAGNYLLI